MMLTATAHIYVRRWPPVGDSHIVHEKNRRNSATCDNTEALGTKHGLINRTHGPRNAV